MNSNKRFSTSPDIPGTIARGVILFWNLALKTDLESIPIIESDLLRNGPLISLRRPTSIRIRQFLAAQNQRELTYQCVGSTDRACPEGFSLDHSQLFLGRGRDLYLAASEAFQERSQFNIPWVEFCFDGQSIRVGQPIGILARSLGLWWLNACRVVQVINFSSSARIRYGFAYGTLPAHLGSGEERFLIEHDLVSDRVNFEVKAISRPSSPLARFGYPWMRHIQRRFGRDALRAFQQRVEQIIDSDEPGP